MYDGDVLPARPALGRFVILTTWSLLANCVRPSYLRRPSIVAVYWSLNGLPQQDSAGALINFELRRLAIAALKCRSLVTSANN